MAPSNESQHRPIISAAATATPPTTAAMATVARITRADAARDAQRVHATLVVTKPALVDAFLQSDAFELDVLLALIQLCRMDANSRVAFDPMIHQFYMSLTEYTFENTRQLHVGIVDSAETYRFCADINTAIIRRWPLKNEIARHINTLAQTRFMEREDRTAPTEKGYELLRNILTDHENHLLDNPNDAEIEDAIQRRAGTERYRITDDFWLRKSDHFFSDDPVTHFVLRDGTCIEIERVSEKTIQWDADEFARCSPLWTLSMARAFCGLDICMPAETRAQLLWIRRFGSDPNNEEVPEKVCETYKGSSVVWYKQTNQLEAHVGDAGFDALDAARIEARANDIMRCF